MTPKPNGALPLLRPDANAWLDERLGDDGWDNSEMPDVERGDPGPHDGIDDDAGGGEVERGSGPAWPPLLDSAALIGLVGDVVGVLEPNTEADPVALVGQLLCAVGSAVGPGPHARAEADRHPARLYVALVGQTSRGRKGSSWGLIRKILATADPAWTARCLATGVSSGEGLIHAVRDPVERDGEIVDPGGDDRRLLAHEPELASVLRVASRAGNIVSAIIRQGWDSGDLRTLTRRDPLRATGAHISIIGHVTRDELLREMNSTEAANGFANRFLWLAVRRSKLLPDGGSLSAQDMEQLGQRTRRVIEWVRELGDRVIERDAAARELWHAVYPALSDDVPGMLGAVTARAEAQVLRLALAYALTDMSAVIRVEHLTAAIAVWEYAAASARYVWGDATGDPIADAILSALRGAGPSGMSRTEIRDLGGRHWPAEAITRALAMLVRRKLVRRAPAPATGGRPVERWVATGAR